MRRKDTGLRTQKTRFKTRDRFRLCVVCLVSYVFLCASVMTAHSAFEDVELGARPLGMGSAFVANADGAGAIFWNSAGLVRGDRRELTMSYMELVPVLVQAVNDLTARLEAVEAA